MGTTPAQRSLVFDELFCFQLALLTRRAETVSVPGGVGTAMGAVAAAGTGAIDGTEYVVTSAGGATGQKAASPTTSSAMPRPTTRIRGRSSRRRRRSGSRTAASRPEMSDRRAMATPA